MDSRLRNLISDYLSAVQSAADLLVQSGMERPTGNHDWAFNGVPQKGLLPGGIQYFKHGYGCSVNLPGGAVDFDFGENGQIDGFDYWRLARFAEERSNTYGFANDAEIKAVFEQSVSVKELTYSGYILYYLAAQHDS